MLLIKNIRTKFAEIGFLNSNSITVEIIKHAINYLEPRYEDILKEALELLQPTEDKPHGTSPEGAAKDILRKYGYNC